MEATPKLFPHPDYPEDKTKMLSKNALKKLLKMKKKQAEKAKKPKQQ